MKFTVRDGRRFVDRIATHALAFAGDGKVIIGTRYHHLTVFGDPAVLTSAGQRPRIAARYAVY